MEQALPVALGVLKLRMQDFKEMTVTEFYHALSGHEWTLERNRRDRAPETASLINVHITKGRKVKPTDIVAARSQPPRNMFYWQIVTGE